MIKKSDKIHHAHCHGVAMTDVMWHTNARKIRRAVCIGCIVNAVLMVLKMVTGHYGHSDALVADGFHSLNDFAADLIMLMFVGISFRGPDSRYSYGYGKFETFSTFLMSSFLIIVSLIIGYEGIESLVGYSRGMELEQPDIWTVIVVCLPWQPRRDCIISIPRQGGKRVRKHWWPMHGITAAMRSLLWPPSSGSPSRSFSVLHSGFSTRWPRF